MKKVVFSFSLIFNVVLASAQQNNSVSVMDFVKIKDEKKAEAIFYYENNWKLYRDIAIKKKLIISYQLVEARKSVFLKITRSIFSPYRKEKND